ncbi:MAG: hypothetical protein ABL957_04220, partial [Parvularculaceae bacterium]
MDTILFVVSLLCLALVAGWYVGNEAVKASGGWGILAVGAPKPGENAAALGRRFNERERLVSDRSEKTAAPAPRGRFLDRDE